MTGLAAGSPGSSSRGSSTKLGSASSQAKSSGQWHVREDPQLRDLDHAELAGDDKRACEEWNSAQHELQLKRKQETLASKRGEIEAKRQRCIMQRKGRDEKNVFLQTSIRPLKRLRMHPSGITLNPSTPLQARQGESPTEAA